MKKFAFLMTLISLLSCTSESPKMNLIGNSQTPSATRSSKEDQDYWYHNKAEISSYRLEQARYGEIHEGTAVFVFVTEPFSPSLGSKSDSPRKDNVSVLKLNHTRKFNTGIYPYSMMTSSFFPFKEGNYSLKLTSSSQEWCGHTFMELNNSTGKFGIQLHSYFEEESFSESAYVKELLEDDIWTMIRIRTNDLPTGEHQLFPPMMYTRLQHIDFKPYKAVLSLKSGDENIYTIDYPEIQRKVEIHFEKNHPHKILSWTETYYDGFGSDRKLLTTKASLMRTINTDYWNKHKLSDSYLRDSLNL